MKLNKVILVLVSVMLFSSCEMISRLFKGGDKHTKGKTYVQIYDKAIEFYEAKRYDKALSLFSNIETAFQGDNKLDTIMFYKANCEYFNRDYYMSSELYNQYRTTMGRGVFAEMADLYYALSLYHISPDVELDQSYTERAINAFKDFAYRNEGHEMIPQCEQYIEELNQRIYESDIHIAKTYFKIGRYKSCIVTLTNILQDDPHTPFREEIMFMIIESNFEYARSSVRGKRKSRFYDTIDGYYRFLEEFPNSELMEKAKKYNTLSESFAEGDAYIHEVSGRVIVNNESIYEAKEKLEAKIVKFEKRGKQEKLEKAKEKLKLINIAIKRLEEAASQRRRDVEINQVK